jgi:hypothetical protein
MAEASATLDAPSAFRRRVLVIFIGIPLSSRGKKSR